MGESGQRTDAATASTVIGPVEAEPLLRITDLAVTFDLGPSRRVRAVNGLSLTIHPGQKLAVVGESGCGKSVTALSTLRLLPSPPGRTQRGAIVFEGRDLLRLGEREMLAIRGGEIAMIFQEPMTSLNPVYTVGDQIIEAIRAHRPMSRRAAGEMARKALEEVGITSAAQRLASYPHQFSGGMRQRVMIAMALACQPKLLLADEPTTALDVTIQSQILELLARLQRSRNMAIMFITHDLCVVAENANVVCVMYAGRVLEYAAVGDLFQRRYHPYTRGLLTCIPSLRHRRPRLTTVEDVVSNPEEFRRLPGYQYGLVPWWPLMDPPEGLVPDERGSTYSLHEVDPHHWVGCWRTKYVADHPARHPDVPPTPSRATEQPAG